MCSPELTRGMCSICFDRIYDGEHWTDELGDKWDSHRWCSLMDDAQVARRDADERRRADGHPTTDEVAAQERAILGGVLPTGEQPT